MAEKTPIPASSFDPSRHVLHGRDAKTGVQKWFALSEIVAAEKAIETVAEPLLPVPEVTKADLLALQTAVHDALANVPPAQFPADLMETFTTMTQTILSLTTRIQKLEADNGVFTENFAQFKALTGVGV
jgi:hypothetical protein